MYTFAVFAVCKAVIREQERLLIQGNTNDVCVELHNPLRGVNHVYHWAR